MNNKVLEIVLDDLTKEIERETGMDPMEQKAFDLAHSALEFQLRTGALAGRSDDWEFNHTYWSGEFLVVRFENKKLDPGKTWTWEFNATCEMLGLNQTI